MKVFATLAIAAAAVSARKLQLRGSSDSFDGLVDGTKAYLESTKDKLFSHGGVRAKFFSVFQTPIQDWFAEMNEKSCGGLQPRRTTEERKALWKTCDHDGSEYTDVLQHMSTEEKNYYNQAFPKRINYGLTSSDKGDVVQDKIPGYSAVRETMDEAGGLEMRCLMLFVIEDKCGMGSSYFIPERVG